MIAEIKREALRRGITRICHFTPTRNLLHIASGRQGILATKHLASDERAIFNPTDLLRLDNYPDHISCSIEYPNVWYFAKKRSEEIIFPDWVILLIKPDYLWLEGTKFSPVNAARGSGRYIGEGFKAFQALFADHPPGSRQKRGAAHLPCCPTDDQAEVLVPDKIKIEDVLAIAVKDESQAKNERARLKYSDVDPDTFNFIIAPDFYNKRSLSLMIRRGVRPIEKPFSGNIDD